MENLYDLLHRCTVRIKAGGDDGEGTGFFVAPGLILTCAHVVSESAARNRPVTVFWQGWDEPAEVGVTRCLRPPDADLALLNVTPTDHPCVLLGLTFLPHHKLYAFGFPGGPKVRGEPITAKVEGRREDYSAAGREEFLKVKDGQISPGFSGAPLLNCDTGGVCGVIKSTRDRTADLGGFAILARVVLAHFPELRGAQGEYHRRNRAWFAAARAEGLTPAVIGQEVTGVGQEVIHTLVNTRDVDRVFSEQYAGLRDAYLEPWPEPFDRVRLEHFQGRRALTAQVDAFLQSKDRGYFFLEADAGLGKTTFLAHLARERGYLHYFFKRASRRDDPVNAVTSLAAQLIRAWELPLLYRDADALERAAGRPKFLERLLAEAAQRRDESAPAEPVVLVVDALDEARTGSDQNLLGLPGADGLPKSVYVLLSSRPARAALRVTGQPAVKLLADSAENQRDMRDYLEAAADRLKLLTYAHDRKPGKADFVATLLEKSRGLWIYLHYVIEEIERRPHPQLDLAGLPEGLWDYYADFWRRERERAGREWHDTLLPLLGTLGAARESMTAEGLRRVAAVAAPAEYLERWLREDWRPFIVVEGGAPRRYNFYHDSLRDFLAGRVSLEGLSEPNRALADELAEATRKAHGRLADRFLDEWGGLAAGLPGLLEPARRDAEGGYGLRHVAAHLELAGRADDPRQQTGEQRRRADELHHLLRLEHSFSVRVAVKRGGLLGWLDRRLKRRPLQEVTRHRLLWYTAREELGDVAGFLGDVQRGWRLAQRAGKSPPAAEARAQALSLQCRYALITASINSLAQEVPPGLMVVAVKRGLRSLEYGLAYARQAPEESQRVSLLSGLALWLAESGAPEKALDLVKEFAPDGAYQAMPALADIAPHLSEPLVREALAMAQHTFPFQAWQALGPLLARLAQLGHSEEALAQARAVEGSPYRVRALAGIIPSLPPPERGSVRAEALKEARAIEEEGGRAQALTTLLQHLESGERAAVLEEALSAARALPPLTELDKEAARARALLAIARHLTEDDRRPIVAEVLELARALPGNSVWPLLPSPGAKVLSDLIPYLPARDRPAVLDEALKLARNVSPRSNKAMALAQLAPHMGEPLLREALEATLAKDAGLSRWALDELAPHLPDHLIREALGALEAIGDAQDQEALPWLLFQAGDFQAALEALPGLYDPYGYSRKAAVLTVFARDLPPSLLPRALQIARKELYGEALSQALSGLVPYLPPKLQRKALTTARRMWDENNRARALEGLAPHLPEPLLRKALSAARKIKSPPYRAQALLGLAPHLPDPARSAVLGEVRSLLRALESSAAGDDVGDEPLIEGWQIVKDQTIQVRLMVRLAALQAEGDGAATLQRALGKVIAVEDGADRLAALKELVPHLTEPLLREATARERARLAAAEGAMSIMTDYLRQRGAPEQAVMAYQTAESEAELKEALPALRPFVEDPAPPAVKAASQRITEAVYGMRALALLVPRFGELGLGDEGLAVLQQLKAGERLVVYRKEEIRQLLNQSLAGSVPFLSESQLQAAGALVPEASLADQVKVARAARLAQLGRHEQALDSVYRLWSTPRTEALIALIPHLPDRLRQERRKVMDDKYARHLDRMRARAGITLRASRRPGSAEGGFERSVLEQALFGAVQLRADVFSRKPERAKALATLVPYAERLDDDAQYDLWCELLPFLAADTRQDLTDVLRSLIRVIESLGGRAALRGAAEALTDVNRCFP